MKCFANLIFTTLLSLSCLTQAAEVMVEHNAERYQFTQRPRLTEVIARLPATAQQSYWSQAALYLRDDLQPEQQKQQLLEQLDAFYQHLRSKQEFELAASVLTLRQQVIGWHVAKRIPMTIDYDLARIALEHNPLFEQGNYLLTTTQRNAVVLLSGLVNHASVPHQPGRFAAEYCRRNKLSGADTYNCILQRPDGTLQQLDVNGQTSHFEVAPGSQLIVLFTQSQLPDNFQTLNQLLIDVARNRIVL